MTDHTLKKIDAEIASIRARVLSMADLVKTQLDDATILLEKCYLERGVSVDKLDERIKELQGAIGRECFHFIALHKPSAGDLRVALSMMRIEAELAAIGEAAWQIARDGEQVHKGGRKDIPGLPQLSTCFAKIKQMLQESIDGFASADPAVLLTMRAQHAALKQELAAFRQPIIDTLSAHTSNVPVQLAALDIARIVERIVELTCHIAVQVAFAATGADLRYATITEIEQAIAQRN